MENKDLLARIESIEKLLAESRKSLSMFGRSYSLTGNSNSDFLIKTKGLVKIQWGSKFIDLIKDGKINADVKIIHKTDSVGVKDGIYVIGDLVIIKVGGEEIPLAGSSGNVYVSFIEEQETTSDLKYRALLNIGFLYKDMDSITDSSLKNGIIYVDSELKFYIVRNGELTEFTFKFPNPFTELFIIAKSDNDKGSLLIKGLGINNSVAFEKLFIYNEFGNSYIASDGSIYFKLGSIDKIVINNSGVTFTDPVISSKFLSENATSTSGFRLYCINNESTLEIDNLIVRKRKDDETLFDKIYPTYWYTSNNIIKKVEITSPTEVVCDLLYENLYLVGDSLCSYAILEGEEFNTLIKVPLTVTAFTSNSITVTTDVSEKLINTLVGQTIFLESSPDRMILRSSNKGIDLVTDSIQTRIGDLSEVVELPITGIYSKQSLFEKAEYTKNYNLPDSDDSSKMASTEWVNKRLNTNIDLSIPTYEVNVESYFTRPEIWELWQNQANNTTRTYTGLHGLITISKLDSLSIFSAIVRAMTDDDTWSYRAVNGTYINSKWQDTSTYIIQSLINPGYYWATEVNDGKPNSPVYIGTTNTETVSKEKPYILYTNDGKVWKIIDTYVELDPNVYYFACSSPAEDNVAQVTGFYPMGFVAMATTNDIVLFTGKSNYLPMYWNGPVDNNMRDKVQALFNKLLANGALPGIIPKCEGLPYIGGFRISDASSLDNTKIFTVRASSGPLQSANTILKHNNVLMRSLAPLSARWVNEDHRIYQLNTPALPNAGDFAIYESWTQYDTLRLFLADMFTEMLYNDFTYLEFQVRKSSMYSENVGFLSGWHLCCIRQGTNFILTMTGEQLSIEPTAEYPNSGHLICYRWGGPIMARIGALSIDGTMLCILDSYEWEEGPSGYKRMATQYLIDLYDGDIYDNIWLPHVTNLTAAIIVTNNFTRLRMQITVDGDESSLVVTNL